MDKRLKSLEIWSFRIGCVHLVFYSVLLVFLSFVSVRVDYEHVYDPSQKTVTKFGRDLLISSAVLTTIPVGLSIFLLVSLFKKNSTFLKIWIYSLSLYTIVYVIFVISSAIYACVKQNIRFGCFAIGFSIFLLVFMALSVYRIFVYKQHMEITKPEEVVEL